MNENFNDRLTYSLACFSDFVAEIRWTQACENPYKRIQKKDKPIVKPQTVWRSLGSGLQLNNNTTELYEKASYRKRIAPVQSILWQVIGLSTLKILQCVAMMYQPSSRSTIDGAFYPPHGTGKDHPPEFRDILKYWTRKSSYRHGRRPTQKWGDHEWTKCQQNANLENSYCSYKNLHQANTVVSQYLNTYRTFTSNTDWNMTHNQTKSLHM